MKCTSATQFEINPMTNLTDLYGTQEEVKQNKAQPNMCWTPLNANKHR
jgi:hypothetical protein